jgi:hypothetical protein
MPIQRQTGDYAVTSTTGETVRAFVPRPLPPDPPLELDSLHPLLDRANQALGRLDGLSTLLPDTELFLYLYVRKEAVLSSQIEGTQSSLSDLLLFENEAAPQRKPEAFAQPFRTVLHGGYIVRDFPHIVNRYATKSLSLWRSGCSPLPALSVR